MTEKCENITDITLSPKFHSGNNIPNEKVRMLLILSLEFNLDNNPNDYDVRLKCMTNIKKPITIITARNSTSSSDILLYVH